VRSISIPLIVIFLTKNPFHRAYIAASRRSDRSLEARIESARRASEIHYRRTGKRLRVTENDVINEEMYEEEDDDFGATYRELGYMVSQPYDPRILDIYRHQYSMNQLMRRQAGMPGMPINGMPPNAVQMMPNGMPTMNGIPMNQMNNMPTMVQNQMLQQNPILQQNPLLQQVQVQPEYSQQMMMPQGYLYNPQFTQYQAAAAAAQQQARMRQYAMMNGRPMHAVPRMMPQQTIPPQLQQLGLQQQQQPKDLPPSSMAPKQSPRHMGLATSVSPSSLFYSPPTDSPYPFTTDLPGESSMFLSGLTQVNNTSSSAPMTIPAYATSKGFTSEASISAPLSADLFNEIKTEDGLSTPSGELRWQPSTGHHGSISSIFSASAASMPTASVSGSAASSPYSSHSNSPFMTTTQVPALNAKSPTAAPYTSPSPTTPASTSYITQPLSMLKPQPHHSDYEPSPAPQQGFDGTADDNALLFSQDSSAGAGLDLFFGLGGTEDDGDMNGFQNYLFETPLQTQY
jgi:hypothetical protein